VGGSVKLNALDNKNVRLGLKYTFKNEPAASVATYDGDGGKLAIRADWEKTPLPYNLRFGGGIELNDAKGKYKDYSAIILDAKGDYQLTDKITLNGRVNIKQTSYAQTDPLKGGKESTNKLTLSVKGNYPLPVAGLIGQGGVTLKSQGSNISNKAYSAFNIGVSVIYIYQ
jgi:hypothetical protein